MGVTSKQVVKFIRKGDKGDKGEQGAVLRGPQAWSDCATGYAFQAGGAGGGKEGHEPGCARGAAEGSEEGLPGGEAFGVQEGAGR